MKRLDMKNKIIVGMFLLALMVSSAPAATINTVLVTTNKLIIPYTGTYSTNNAIKLGTNTLVWAQAGKSSNIVANLPANIPSGTYLLILKGATPVNVEIGSVAAAAALNARIDAETKRAQDAETGLTNAINAEAASAMAAENVLSNSISTETLRAQIAEANLAGGLIAVSNSLAAMIDSRIIAVSNSIVASLTKHFTTAYIFGAQTVNPYSLVNFTSYTNDWTTNGTYFKIPATGVYQISFAFNFTTAQPAEFLVNVSNENSTNGVGYFKSSPPYNQTATLNGQTTVQCLQGDQISFYNASAYQNAFGNAGNWIDISTNVPSATLSIIQIQ